MEAKTPLVGLTKEEIGQQVGSKLRGKQIAAWLYKKTVFDFQQMTDLPPAFRTELEQNFIAHPLQVAKHLTSKDGVDKLLVHRGDEQVFECVLLPYEDRVSCCLSSQVGCPMGCLFCATGLGGFDRNLTAAEMVGQYLMLQQVRYASAPDSKISHVVFMGMGEPLLNYDNLVKTLRILHEEVGLSYRRLTVSTVGLVPQILKLAKEEIPIHLALSLHSPNDDIRGHLMPVNKKWPVKEVWAAMREHHKITGRKVTVEYLLINELTDTLEQAADLAKLVKGTPTLVNVIPFNYVDTENGFSRPSRERVRAFKAELRSRGIEVSERMERGHDIAAACGQLAGAFAAKSNRRKVEPLSVLQ